jgi:hypothetical protein
MLAPIINAAATYKIDFIVLVFKMFLFDKAAGPVLPNRLVRSPVYKILSNSE